MSRFFLLGIVGFSLFFLAPRVVVSRSISVEPLLTRTFIDVIDEGEVSGEDIADYREENREDGKLEERRDDARDFAESKDDEE